MAGPGLAGAQCLPRRRVAAARNLSVDERRRRVQELQTQAEAELIRALGDKAARGARRSLGVNLNMTTANLRP